MIKTKGQKIAPFPFWYAWNGINKSWYTFSGISSYESITYEKPRFKRFGDCVHTEALVKINPDGICVGTPARSGSSYPHSLYRPLVVSPPDSGFNSRAFQAMKPRIAPVIDVPLELKELVGGWKELLMPFRKGSSGLSKAGSSNLWYQFGIAPTIGSAKDAYEGILNFQKRLDEFIKLQGKELTSHYSEVTTVPQADIQIGYASSPQWIGRQRNSSYKIKHTATMKYKYSIQGIKEMSAKALRLKALGDAWGISRPIAMIYNGTPWTFIIDWFFNVGDFLEQFDTPFLKTDVEVIDYCISTKTDRFSTVEMSRPVSGYVLSSTVLEKQYTRTRCLPDYSLFGIRESDNFGIRQFLLGLSLLVA